MSSVFSNLPASNLPVNRNKISAKVQDRSAQERPEKNNVQRYESYMAMLSSATGSSKYMGNISEAHIQMMRLSKENKTPLNQPAPSALSLNRRPLLSKVVGMVSILAIVAFAGFGYWQNIASTSTNNQDSTALTIANINGRPSIIQPAGEHPSEIISLMGIQHADGSLINSANTTGMTGLDDSDIAMPSVAAGRNDPFEPVLDAPIGLPGADSSPGGSGLAPEEMKESLQIQFSGLVDDPKNKKKVVILKVQNPDASAGSQSPAFITVIKKVNDSFMVAGRKVVIRSIGNDSVKMMVDGEMQTLSLNDFDALPTDASAIQPASLNQVTGQGTGGVNVKPVNQMDSPSSELPTINKITPAQPPSQKPIIKLSE